MTDELAQPDIDDSRWEIDEQRHFVGMDCTVDHNGEEVAGEVAAIWLFRGESRARRRRPRGRYGRQHQQGAGQFRELVALRAMKIYKQAPGRSYVSRTGEAQNTTAEEPRPGRARPAKSNARAGSRMRFFCGRRNKRLASSASYAQRRGVFGRRAGRDTTSMRYAQANQPQERSRLALQRSQCGSTLGAVERIVEESHRTYLGVSEHSLLKEQNAGRSGGRSGRTFSKISKVSSIPPYYRYHTSDTTHNTPHATATSHVVAPATPVESRGGRR